MPSPPKHIGEQFLGWFPVRLALVRSAGSSNTVNTIITSDLSAIEGGRSLQRRLLQNQPVVVRSQDRLRTLDERSFYIFCIVGYGDGFLCIVWTCTVGAVQRFVGRT